MMRALFSGVSGLKNHQTRMDVIGNNISNVNTIGYKGSRVNFQDLLSQTLQGAVGGDGTKGGTNPIQVGLGMGIASIDTDFGGGSAQYTGKSTDLMINNAGFFALNNGTDTFYTRAGNFGFDTAGNFVVPGTGYKVMGWMADTAGNINSSSNIGAISLADKSALPSKATALIQFGNNLGATESIGTSKPVASNIVDVTGNVHHVTTVFTKVADGTWIYNASADDGAALSPTQMGEIKFDAVGNISSIKSLTPANVVQNAASFNAIKLDNQSGSVQNGYFLTYDSNNTPHVFNITYTNTGTNAWTYSISDNSGSAMSGATGTITYNTGTQTYTGFPVSFSYTPPGGTVQNATLSAAAGSIQSPPDIGAFNFKDKPVMNQTTSITLNNLQLDSTSNSTQTKYFTVFDSNMAPHSIKMTLANASGTSWNYSIVDANNPLSVPVTGTISYSAGSYAFPASFQLNGLQTINFNIPGTAIQAPPAAGGFSMAESPTYGVSSVQYPTTYIPGSGQKALPLALKMDKITQYGTSSSISGAADGYKAGTLDLLSISIDQSGIISGKFSNDQVRALGQVALANFNNPGGLTRSGTTLFAKSLNSGEPQIGTCNTGGRGSITAGSLEMSNVDLSQEFSNMIITERGFQANSKIISVSDEMLQDLTNLKR